MKNGKIEILRFVFCTVIVLFHARNILPEENVVFKSGAFAVEFFAIVSGYLMMASIEKIEKKSCGHTIDLGKESLQFLWRKVKNLYPEIIVAWMLALLVRQITNYQGIEAMIKMALNGFWELTLLQMSGLLTGKINSVTWYISAMILSMAILYPLLRRYKSFMLNIGCPLIIVVLFGWLCREYVHLRTPLEWTGFAYKGTLRIFAELCVGVFSYQLAQWLQKLELTKIGK